LTLLVGRHEEHLACKNRAMRFWCGYLSEAKCRLLAYSPADATAITKPDHLLPDLNPDWFYLSGTGLPRLSYECSDRRIKLIMICTESSFVYGLLFYKFLSPTRVVPVQKADANIFYDNERSDQAAVDSKSVYTLPPFVQPTVQPVVQTAGRTF